MLVQQCVIETVVLLLLHFDKCLRDHVQPRIHSLSVSIYMIFVVAFATSQTKTVTIFKITPAIFDELRLKYGKTLSCPCSTASVPYKNFVFHTIKFDPICSSVFVSQQWIEALYLPTPDTFDALDFRKTAHSQVSDDLLIKIHIITTPNIL